MDLTTIEGIELLECITMFTEVGGCQVQVGGSLFYYYWNNPNLYKNANLKLTLFFEA